MSEDVIFLIVLIVVSIIVINIFSFRKSKLTPEEKEKKEQEYNEWKQQMLEMRNGKINEQGQLVCPKCGSTQIQMVSRRWSLLSGFLTNKVDRVCVRCKNRF